MDVEAKIIISETRGQECETIATLTGSNLEYDLFNPSGVCCETTNLVGLIRFFVKENLYGK